jgi:uncharacterized protein
MSAVPARPISPCISICRMSPQTGLCEGCARTIDEIAAWGTMSEPQRQAVWALIDQRRAAQPAA